MTSTAIKSFVSNQGNLIIMLKINKYKDLLIEDCHSPEVILVVGTSSLLSPIQFRRSQDFSIISIIELNCNESLSTTTQWTIKNCTSICLNQIQIDQKIIPFGKIAIHSLKNF